MPTLPYRPGSRRGYRKPRKRNPRGRGILFCLWLLVFLLAGCANWGFTRGYSHYSPAQKGVVFEDRWNCGWEQYGPAANKTNLTQADVDRLDKVKQALGASKPLIKAFCGDAKVGVVPSSDSESQIDGFIDIIYGSAKWRQP